MNDQSRETGVKKGTAEDKHRCPPPLPGSGLLPPPPPFAQPVSTPAGVSSGPPRMALYERLRRTAAIWARLLWTGVKWISWEAKAVAQATFAQVVRLARFAAAKRRLRVQKRAVEDAELALGRKMYQSGIGDPDLIRQIADLTRQIEGPPKPTGGRIPLAEQRRELTRRLARPALAQPEPQARIETEWRACKMVEDVAVRQRSEIESLSLSLWPQTPAASWRVCAGVAFLAASLVVGLGLVLSWGMDNEEVIWKLDSERPSSNADVSRARQTPGPNGHALQEPSEDNNSPTRPIHQPCSPKRRVSTRMDGNRSDGTKRQEGGAPPATGRTDDDHDAIVRHLTRPSGGATRRPFIPASKLPARSMLPPAGSQPRADKVVARQNNNTRIDGVEDGVARACVGYSALQPQLLMFSIIEMQRPGKGTEMIDNLAVLIFSREQTRESLVNGDQRDFMGRAALQFTMCQLLRGETTWEAQQMSQTRFSPQQKLVLRNTHKRLKGYLAAKCQENYEWMIALAAQAGR